MEINTSSNGSDEARRLLAYIQQSVVRVKTEPLDENTPLVSSGLVDSLALIDVFLQLEQVTNRSIPRSKVRTKDMDTVGLMLSMAARIGRPKA